MKRNSVYELRPELVKFFENEEDAKNNTRSSTEKVKMKCPYCGYKRERRINILVARGFCCPCCGDGVSYPEKVMSRLLQQLMINFEAHYRPEWAKNIEVLEDESLNGQKEYDFYFELDKEVYIVEIMGVQHYKHTGFGKGKVRSLEQEQLNDKIKKEVAIDKCLKKEVNYIVINCKRGDLPYIKNNILKSNLAKIFDLSKVDWNDIADKCERSLVREVCNYWNKHENEITPIELAEHFKICQTTATRYLKRGTGLGWLNNPYDGKRESDKGKKLKNSGSKSDRAKKICIYSNDLTLLYEIGSIKEAGKWLIEKGYINTISSATTIIKRNRNNCQAHTFVNKPNESLFFFGHRIRKKDRDQIEFFKQNKKEKVA